MTILIAIEGAAGNARKPGSPYQGSFIDQIEKNWPGPSHYNWGPMKFTGAIENVAKNCLSKLQGMYSSQTKGICLVGYSRGGAAAIRLAQLLDEQGIQVDCLGLIDAVNMDPAQPTLWIPGNVQLTAHAMRDPAGDSKTMWGNCGTSGPNTFHSARIMVTHWGASGVPAHHGPSYMPPGATLSSLVDEDGDIPGYSGPHTTRVTWRQELYAAPGLRDYVMGFVNATRRRLDQKPGTNPPGGGIGTNPPGGGTGGGGALPTGQIYTVVPGDSLSLITQKFWGDMMLFPLIHDANAATIGPDWNLIKPGMKLTIPDKAGYSPTQLEDARKRARSG
jgi:hypothetical protein